MKINLEDELVTYCNKLEIILKIKTVMDTCLELIALIILAITTFEKSTEQNRQYGKNGI